MQSRKISAPSFNLRAFGQQQQQQQQCHHNVNNTQANDSRSPLRSKSDNNNSDIDEDVDNEVILDKENFGEVIEPPNVSHVSTAEVG